MITHFIFGLVGSFWVGWLLGLLTCLSWILPWKKYKFRSHVFCSCCSGWNFSGCNRRDVWEIDLTKNRWISRTTATGHCFVMLGLFFLYKRDNPRKESKTEKNSSTIANGFIVAFLNPQAIPYWIFVLAYLKSIDVLYLNSWHLFLFLSGASIGKFIILGLYSYLSEIIQRHFENLNEYVSKVIGGLLLGIGLAQAVRYFFF